VPHYFNPVSVGPGPSQNRTCRFPASGSSGRLTDISLIADSVPLTMLSQVLCPALSPFLDTPACQSLLSTGIARLHWYYGLIRLPVPRPQTSFPQFQVPLCRGRYRSSQVPEKSLQQHAVDYDPGGVSAISPLTMTALLPSVFLITWVCSPP
jgi:hypothetical protein